MTITDDPRAPATAAAIRAQYALLRKFNSGAKTAYDGYQQVEVMRSELKAAALADSAPGAAKALRDFRAKVDTVGGNAGIGGRRPPPNFHALNATFIGEITAQDNGDHAPTEAALSAYTSVCRDLKTVIARWTAINKEITTVNAVLAQDGKPALAAAGGLRAPDCGESPAQSAPRSP